MTERKETWTRVLSVHGSVYALMIRLVFIFPSNASCFKRYLRRFAEFVLHRCPWSLLNVNKSLSVRIENFKELFFVVWVFFSLKSIIYKLSRQDVTAPHPIINTLWKDATQTQLTISMRHWSVRISEVKKTKALRFFFFFFCSFHTYYQHKCNLTSKVCLRFWKTWSAFTHKHWTKSAQPTTNW